MICLIKLSGYKVQKLGMKLSLIDLALCVSISYKVQKLGMKLSLIHLALCVSISSCGKLI